MIDDAIGYRAGSITDSWTGISRLKPEHQERIKRAAILIIGTDAYKYMKQGEQIVQRYAQKLVTPDQAAA